MARNGSVVLSGEVLDVTHRSGVAKGSGNPYDFYVVSVLAGKTVLEVTWGDVDECGPVPSEGAQIQTEVELGTYAGRLQVNAVRPVRPGVRAASAG